MVVGYNLVDQPHVQGLLGGVEPAQEPYLASLLLPHYACQVGGTETGIETAHLRTSLPELGIVGGYGKVAYNVKHMPAAHGKAVDHGNDGFGYGAYLFLYVQNGKVRHTVLAYVSATSLHVHVATGAEGIGAHPILFALSLLAGRVGTGQDDHAYGA